ncbi:MAG: hypothetical protein ACD_74C00037G0001, partial [uncultured bacterium]
MMAMCSSAMAKDILPTVMGRIMAPGWTGRGFGS